MRSITFFTALALMSSQLVASAPAPQAFKERNVENVERDTPSWWMNGNNPWAQNMQHPPHQGPQPGGHHTMKDKPGNNGQQPSNGNGGNAPKPTDGHGGGKPTKKPGNAPGHGGQKHRQHPGAGMYSAPPSNSMGHKKPTQAKNKKPAQGSTKPQPSNGSGGSTGGSSNGAGYQAEVLKCHNVHRANHSSPALSWSGSLAATAQKIAETCYYGHSMGVDGGGYGQNIAAGVAPDGISNVISNMFYNHEMPYFAGQYGNPNPTGFEHWGHFSQVVWKKTSQVGCHTCDCSGKGLANTGGNVKPFFTVCNYKGPGNVAGQYAENIGKPLGHPTVSG